MKEKKVSPEWYVAITHWLTAGFVIPFISVFVLGIPLALLLGKDNPSLLAIAIGLLSIVSYWLGVMYSARYLDKTYVIKNAQKISSLSTIYLLVIGGGYRLYGFLQTGLLKTEYIIFLFILVVFYISSKKYIKNNV